MKATRCRSHAHSFAHTTTTAYNTFEVGTQFNTGHASCMW